MLRTTVSPEIVSSGDDNAGGGGLGFRSMRDRFRFKRNSNDRSNTKSIAERKTASSSSLPDRQWRPATSRSNRSVFRKWMLFPFRCRSFLYFCILLAVFAFALASMVLQTSIMSVFRQGNERGRSVRPGLKFGSSLEFVPGRSSQRIELGDGLNHLRNLPRVGIRPPKLAIILGQMKSDSSTLMLFTMLKNLKGLGYVLKIYAAEDGEARPMWEKIGGHVSTLGPQSYGHIDWTMFEGIIVDSLGTKDTISSLMQEPFCSVPLIWIIQDTTLANRLSVYQDMGWEHLISYWKNAFSRADAVVFPDFSLPMLYSVLDTGNFFVIPGSPVDVWAAETYAQTHSRAQLRKDKGYNEEEMLVLIVGSSFFYKELSWDYAVSMHNLGPLLSKYARVEDDKDSFNFVFLCGNSSDGYNEALQDIASHMGLHSGSVRHYGLDDDVNGLLLMADIVLFGSSQDEQGFPPLLTRAMSFGIPVIAPDYPVITKYVVDGVHAMIFTKHEPDALMTCFSLLISKGKLSKFAHAMASSGRLVARNMLASDCIIRFAKLVENVLTIPSDVMLPGQVSQLKQGAWEWYMFQTEIERNAGDRNFDLTTTYSKNSNVITNLEEEMTNHFPEKRLSQDEADVADDVPSQLDWDIVTEIENSEEVQRLELEEVEERFEKAYGSWDELYRNVRKAEKIKSETNERDEGELERTGQPVCIYEIYNGAGAWPFLHHGSLYRGLSLSTRARRLRSDDVDAVSRLPLLNDNFYRDILCEIGGMFAIANSVDNIHKRPWIGYQSWRASGRKVSLSSNAEKALEETIQEKPKGDVIYFWARMDMDGGHTENNDILMFWSMCDILNGGNCRTAFEDAFRRMYALPSHIEALPPMPEDGGHWSALHSWVMPTPSFIEFVMFSRMFADSLDIVNNNSSKTSQCMLGVSMVEKRHCYCRVLEFLVNIWAYHSGRKMVYINPETGLLEEQHPVEQRKTFMWAKYFNITLLKSMDEDLAEAADDGDHPTNMWLWPLTGEVYWQGVYEREREERYRLKMEKKRKTKEKLLERMKYGYKQKSLGG